jgi:hypothetical protein
MRPDGTDAEVGEVAMPTAEETAFMNDPAAFMRDNIIRVVCGKQHAGTYNFSLVQDNTVLARKKNRRGRAIGYFKLQQNDSGDIPMHFLPYQDNGVREMTLPVANDTPDLMVTVNLNGCSFGFAQTNQYTGAYVTHHNDRAHGNDPTIIEEQKINNPFDATFRYFHQTGYRKVRGGTVDQRYQATIVGKRDVNNRWHFYCQFRKDLMADKQRAFWTLKGVKEINP